ncbi:hypothetical protein [Natrinema sp. 1APR25-10V2]|uniref:hypothetical protein n=1 Tax=Natrinema sp. 1APR25-10V2 TaxID=2951081 RepID=UPI002875BB64|nr:hypothetical protein [Natrinema sp. 1APR25-10V2]MDS0474985.1 hypothetical protein [Natrinema sp. 1APR25-10V2]
MSLTVDFSENENVTLTDSTIEVESSDRLDISVEGRLAMSEALLAQFEGATLGPVAVTVSSDDSGAATIDLTGPATLRLETVDVGAATVDRDEIPTGVDELRSSTDGGPGAVDSPPDVLAFTVEGTIREIPEPTFEETEGDPPQLESLTFAVDETVRSDGGSGDDVVVELTLFGYGIVVRRDGSIVVGSADGLDSIDLP